METVRISFLSAMLVPLALWSACGGSDNTPAAGSSTGGGTSTGGSTSTGATSGTGATTMGSGAMGGGMGVMTPTDARPPNFTQPVAYDKSCPDQVFTAPDGGFPTRDGGPMAPPGFSLPDGGLTFKGCCTTANVCGWAITGTTPVPYSFCFNPRNIPGRGAVDAGPPPKACTYKAP